MLTRLTHAGVAFALTVAAYQTYVLALAPLIEPPGAAALVTRQLTAEELLRAPSALEKYQPLLDAYFPADHWSHAAPPKILENGQAMVVFDQYLQSISGELRLPRLALVFFPTLRDPAAAPPRDAIILEPSGGATLQMDQQVGQKFAALGRMQYGQLLGDVLVRSDMREPGPHDDLLITTKDLYMNEEFIRTTEAVTLRLGQHHGRGRGLEIRFYKTEATSGAAPATIFGKLDTLVISHEVAALIAPSSISLFGQDAAPPAGSAAGSAGALRKLSDAPAEITCAGSFQIDFDNHVATFAEDVRVSQRHPDGTFDELRAPRDLTLYFAETREWVGTDAPAPAHGQTSLGSLRLEPATVEAFGTPGAPVVLSAPSQGARARGDRVCIELIPRRVTVEGGEEIVLNYRGAEVHAPMIWYELPPRGSTQRLGVMAARGGSGRLRAVPDERRPGDVLEVSWQQSMQLVRSSGQPLLRLDGRPKVSMLGLGRLWADQLELYLRETAATAPAPNTPGRGGLMPSSIEAERVLATGNVDIESAELTGNVSQLDLKIHNPSAASPPQTSATFAGAATGGAASPAPAAASPAGAAPSAPLFDRQRSATGPARAYAISGRVLEIDAVMRERRPVVAAIRVDGDVLLQESTVGTAGEAPLRIVAEHVNVTDADTPQAKIEIRGADPAGAVSGAAIANGAVAGLAEIAARGTILRAPVLAVNRGTNQAWINSPGEVLMLMTRDAQGQPLAQPQPVRITWRDAMELNADRITFRGDVRVENPQGWLRTQRMVAVLSSRVAFDGAANGAAPELAELQCWEGAVAEFSQRDAVGTLTSHQHLEVASLRVNQQSGALQGEGPGHLDSVHYSKGDGAWLVAATQAGTSAPPPPPDIPAGPPQLKHLSLGFVRGVEGNIHTPDVRVFGDVRTIYGPVETWDQRLTMSPGGLPGPDTFWITCGSLRVTDSQLARIHAPTVQRGRRAMGQVELLAELDVVIEGAHPKHGEFTLRGSRASFDQAKGTFVLEGRPATVILQEFPGAPAQPQTADKWFYNLNTGHASITGFSKIDFSVFDKP